MELLRIVNENGEFTGEIMEREKVHELNLFHWEVGTFIINNKNETLLQKRSLNKRSNPNKWAICAGHVDINEELEEAAIREINEEIGLDVLIKDLKLLKEKEVVKKESNYHLNRFYYIFCNKDEKEFIIQKEELSEVKWFHIDNIIKMINNNDDTLVFKKNRLYLFEKLKDICKKYNE